MSEIVVVTADDLEPAIRLRGAFDDAGFEVEVLARGEDLSDVRGRPLLLVLTGGLHGRRSRHLVEQARAQRDLPVIALFESTEIASRQTCQTLGFSDCFSKPIDVDEVVLVGRRLVERGRLRRITGITGETEVMEEVLERVVQIAAVDSTVLIQGESGTGKELVARGLHALSPRRHRPFIAANVAALPESLLESELFGHEKGAFTGAASLRKGLFELAHGGTVFLDEIGEMPLSTQTKLLRVLEEREFRRVGGEDLLRVDVRVVAATNRDLREQLELGNFRRDLYHRLNVLRIYMPSLRERREDIPRLIDEFVHEFAQQHDRPFRGIDPEALQILVEYAWPGNVRELRNLVESMVVLAHGRTIRPEDIPPEVREGGRRPRTLLPVLAQASAATGAGERASPEMEFIVRTIFDLKLDLEDLRREVAAFRERRERELEVPYLPSFASLPPLRRPLEGEEESTPESEGTVVFRPGTTMRELEREAITVALREVHGNRRRAAEMLGIGERTLYRKIKEYGLES